MFEPRRGEKKNRTIYGRERKGGGELVLLLLTIGTFVHEYVTNLSGTSHATHAS